jgi:hypothetical protein
MQEYRFIFTGTFITAIERDKAADWLESQVALLGKVANFKRADITRDDYPIPDLDVVSKKVI